MSVLEHIVSSELYWLIKPILYIILIGSGIATFVIPTFRNNKMMKQGRPFTRPLLTKWWRNLAFYGRLFVFTVVISIITGLLLSKLDNTENEIAAKKDAETNEKHLDEILSNKLQFQAQKDSITRVFSDRLAIERSNSQIKTFNDSINRTNTLVREGKLVNEKLTAQLDGAHKENTLLQQELNSPVIEETKSPGINFNPILLYDSSRNSFTYWMYYENIGKGKAEKIRISVHVFDINPNTYLGKTEGTYEDTTTILDERGIAAKAVFPISGATPYYLLLKIRYKNHFGKEMTPFLKVYYVDQAYINRPIPKVKTVTADLIKSLSYRLNLD